MYLLVTGRMRLTALVCFFSGLCSFASVSSAAPSNPDETVDPWRRTGINLGFLDEKIGTAKCSRSDREFLSCISAVQRVLDVAGHDLQLIPVTNLVAEADWDKVLERFGTAAVVKDAATRIGAAGNALDAIRARAHRILRWRDRLDPSLREGVEFTAIRNWLKPNLNGLLLDLRDNAGGLIGIERDIEVYERPGAAPRDRIFLREQDLFPTALPLERQVWKHPDSAWVNELDECAKKTGLAKHRMRPDAEMSRAMDYPLAVAQDALICSLTRPRSANDRAENLPLAAANLQTSSDTEWIPRRAAFSEESVHSSLSALSAAHRPVAEVAALFEMRMVFATSNGKRWLITNDCLYPRGIMDSPHDRPLSPTSGRW